MMKLRKTLVTLLVLSMVLAGFTGVAGATFSDTADHKAANKIEKLAALGVLAGYPDGTFKPDNNITRAEFAKIACVLAGLSSSGDILKNSPSKFSDVPAGEWYTGWVNLAVSQGYMKGYPDGTFKPQANVTNAEVLTVLCRLLGYNDNLPGEWPIEYLVKAADLDISDGVTFDGSSPATRANVCWFAEQSLDVEIMEWDKDKEKFEKADPVETILSENFEGAVEEDQIVTTWDKSGDNFRIKIADTTWVPLAEDCTINGADNAKALNGKIVDYITNDDDEACYVEVRDYGSVYDTEADVTDTKIEIDDKTYTVADDAKYLAGGVFDDFENWANGTKTGDRITCRFNDDGDVLFVSVTNTSKPAIVDEVLTASEKINTKVKGDQTGITAMNAELKDSDYIVFRDGKIVDLEDIEEWDLLWIDDTGDYGFDYVITAESGKATGTFDEHSDELDVFTIGGKDYDVGVEDSDVVFTDDDGDSWTDPIALATDVEDALGEEVTALIDSLGYVRAIRSDVGTVENAQYGVVTRMYYSTVNGDDELVKVQVLKPDGDKASFEVDDDSEVDENISVADLVKYNLQANGNIDEMVGITTSGDIPDAGDGVDTDNERIKIGTNWYTTSALVVFNVYTEPAPNDDPDDFETLTYSDVEDYLNTLGADLTVKYKSSDNKLQYLVLNQRGLGATTDYAMVLKKGYATDGKYLKVDVAGTAKTYDLTTTGDGDGDWATVDEGVMITYTLSGDKINTFDDCVATKVGVEVYSVKATDKSVKIDDVWYTTDDDSAIYDFTGDDPVYVQLSDVSAGQVVDFEADADGVIEWIVITD